MNLNSNGLWVAAAFKKSLHLYSARDPDSVFGKGSPGNSESMGMIVTQVVIIILLLVILGLFAFDDRRNRKLREIEDRVKETFSEDEGCEPERD